MQHRYVPDLGDFSKFVVIDALSGAGGDRTALIWYLVNPHEVGDQHNNDGKHTGYLEHDRQGFAQCHRGLYERFQVIYRSGEKHVGVYERHNILPNMDYFPDLLSYDGLALNERGAWRAGWLRRAVQVAENSDVVVLDPDNGLMADRLSIRSRSAVKYASLDECRAFYDGGQRTLVVYQHAHRRGSVARQTDLALSRLSDHLAVPRHEAFALRFHRGTSRCYLVVPTRGRGPQLRERAAVLTQGAWGRRGHFSLID